MRIAIIAALFACTASPLVASEPESDNVGHTRHHHPHNPKHETTLDEERFYTDRESPVEIPLPVEEDAFSFVIFGDRTGGPDAGVSILADAIRDVNLLEPDLVMTVGDLIQGYNESVPWITEMEEYKAVMGNLLCPWFPVAGNHDTYWRFQGNEERPEEEHEGRYEMHFGPLWYSFSHKNTHFIVLYTDEGNPETGERTFHKPASQRMSPEQKQFLQEALDRGEEADNIFVFVHHPRWLKGNYGDDWDTVHKMLVEAGNVSAVFAGHIHYMRHDGKRDGIEYVSLATTGGHQGGSVPDAGHLHHYHVVTVRKDQFAMAAYPVGEVLDVRDITGELATQTRQLAGLKPSVERVLRFEADGSASDYVETKVENPTDYAMSYTISAYSMDSRWFFPIDHHHGRLEAGESRMVGFRVLREPGEIDRSFRVPMIALDRSVMTKSFRYDIPTVEVPMPIDPGALPRPAKPMREMALGLEQDNSLDAVEVASDSFTLGQGAFTLECWFNAESYARRTGLVCKTEGSDYGIFVNNGQPGFSVHLDGSYVTAKVSESILSTDRWHHVAGVYDGSEVRLYVDGELVARKAGSGKRDTNTLPLMIGADVNGSGQATSPFTGSIDEVRLSGVARYSGQSFAPARWFRSDDDTVLLYHMDGQVGPWVYDESESQAHGWLLGDAVIDMAE